MTEGRRRWVFICVVLGLAAIGVYLTVLAPPTGTSSDGAVPPVQDVGRTAPAPPPVPATPSPPPSAESFDIYRLLPLSKEEFAASADVAYRFATAYGGYRHDEDPAVHARRISVFTTPDLGRILARGVLSPGELEQNRADQVVSQASAEIREIRDVKERSVVYVVGITQRITAKSGSDQRTEEYAITVSQVGADWKVHDIQQANAGQEGDPH
ncbi:hypothetical protein [Rhizohabitans arisaemae]|uniref:hypothetical protein n=1 Tax=Rhizohabitans arisaemae TaxID=2720610 RepID=UPI0024B17BE4|nr:hypothetical protein [Rhizohabitans arisaemae]